MYLLTVQTAKETNVIAKSNNVVGLRAAFLNFFMSVTEDYVIHDDHCTLGDDDDDDDFCGCYDLNPHLEEFNDFLNTVAEFLTTTKSLKKSCKFIGPDEAVYTVKQS